MEGPVMPTPKKYRLFIDETGNHHYGRKSGQHLGLLGVIVEEESYVESFKPALLQIKRDYFSDDPDVPVILHREDMLKRTGLFECLGDKEHRHKFNRSILEFFCKQSYTLISVVIDKPSHLACYGDDAKHPYHYCSEALLERFCYFLEENDAVGDVMAESRGGAEDALLNKEWSRFCNDGTFYIQRSALAARLTTDNMKFQTKQDNVYGLQVADLLVTACTREVLVQYGHCKKHKETFNKLVAETVEEKYRRAPNGSPQGWGMKMLYAKKNRPR